MSFHYNSIQWCERLSGVQLYSVRHELEKNVPRTLAALSAAGFREVEFAGYYQIPPAQMKALLEQTQLRAVSTHVGLDLLYADLYGQLAYARCIGVRYIVLSYVAPQIFADPWQFAELKRCLSCIAKQIRAWGFQFLYHNHAAEWQRIGSGFVLDELLQAAGPEGMQLELDTYWIAKAGLDPVLMLKRYAGLVKAIHLKDMSADGEITEVGRGVLDWPSILAAARAAGVCNYFIELDNAEELNPARPITGLTGGMQYIQCICRCEALHSPANGHIIHSSRMK
jgi:sugar phosphate isomerase/epimerase